MADIITRRRSPASGIVSEFERPAPLGEHVYELLLSQLISLKIPPGSRISVDNLVRELGVSQTPIRQALIRLESEGLVEKIHNIGYSAARMPSRRRFNEIYEMRLLLEPFIAARAAEHITAAGKKEVADLAEAMAKPSSDDARVAYGNFATQDARLHSLIASHANNDLAADALARLHAHINVFRLQFHSQVTDEAIKEHRKIVKALAIGDRAAARDAMESHILKSRDRMAPFFEMLD